jgi:hypothetical protein
MKQMSKVTFPLLALIVAFLSGCRDRAESGLLVTRHYGEQIRLSDGRIIYADREEQVGPNEFLQPGLGNTSQITIKFKLPDQEVIWTGIPPDSTNKHRDIVPITFDVLNSTPVAVVSIYYNCQNFSKPSDVMAAYAYDGHAWKRISFELIPLTWRTNLMKGADKRNFHSGYTYSIEDKKLYMQADPDDYSKPTTLAHEVERYRGLEKYLRGMNSSCAQSGA